MPDYSREELVTELKRRRAQPVSEPNVPEWAGRYPNVYGLAGAAREAIQPFMRGSLVDVGLSKAVGYPTPEFMTEEESMMLPIAGMYVGPSSKGWSGLKGKFSGMADKAERAEISDVGAKIQNRDYWREKAALKETNPKAYKALDRYDNMSLLKMTDKQKANRQKLVREADIWPDLTRGTLESQLEHPELYRQYPELAKISVETSYVPGIKGSYQKDWGGKITLKSGTTPESAKDTLLHEIQHAIQEKEGWARGGNPEEFSKGKLDSLVREKERLEHTAKELYRDKLSGYKDYGKEYVETELGKLGKRLSELKNVSLFDDPVKQYRRLAGEIESRDTSARAGLTADQRASTLPYTSEDIPLSEWIVKKDKGASGQFTRAELVDELKRRRQTK